MGCAELKDQDVLKGYLDADYLGLHEVDKVQKD